MFGLMAHNLSFVAGVVPAGDKRVPPRSDTFPPSGGHGHVVLLISTGGGLLWLDLSGS